jgi:hypothetical protein
MQETTVNFNYNMPFEDTLLQLRLIARKKGKYVMNKLFNDYLTGPFNKETNPSCTLCGSETSLTTEHVLPKWVFEKDPKRTFTTEVNELSQKYIGTTILMCSVCNSELLNTLERYIQESLSVVDLETRYYSSEEWENIIRWLETIDFKFQVFDIVTKFRAHKKAGYIPFLADFSIAEIRDEAMRSIKSKARLALKRISTKNKGKMFNSLIVGKTKAKTFHYFHRSGKFIYLEIPTYNKVFFYFFDREFKNDKKAEKEAMKIIKSVYEVD